MITGRIDEHKKHHSPLAVNIKDDFNNWNQLFIMIRPFFQSCQEKKQKNHIAGQARQDL
jgi:hypothetical protein